jgi:predicted dehydrogenase
MKKNSSRREFLQKALLAGTGINFFGKSLIFKNDSPPEGTRIGIIGLDTSHCPEFTKIINSKSSGTEFHGYKVVAAYPTSGSSDFPSSINRLAGFTEQLRKMGVEIVNSEDELLQKVDFVLLESVDGRPHLAQALPVLKAGKRLFIDKPLSSSLAGAVAIFEASKKYNVPLFSSSDERFAPTVQEIITGKTAGNVLGADTYCSTGLAPGHPDLFFYGIHGVETLFTVMGTGCKTVSRFNTKAMDVVVGTWSDGRIGTFRGTPREGKSGMGGTVFGTKGIAQMGKSTGYEPMIQKIIDFFNSGIVPVKPEETLEILAFMEAADISKQNGGKAVSLDSVLEKAKQKAKKLI